MSPWRPLRNDIIVGSYSPLSLRPFTVPPPQARAPPGPTSGKLRNREAQDALEESDETLIKWHLDYWETHAHAHSSLFIDMLLVPCSLPTHAVAQFLRDRVTRSDPFKSLGFDDAHECCLGLVPFFTSQHGFSTSSALSGLEDRVRCW